MKNLLFVCTILLLASCEGYDTKLKIINKSTTDLYIIAYDTSSLTDYPNKVLDFDPVEENAQIGLPIFGSTNGTWVNYVKSSRNGKLNLFAIKKSVVDSMARDSIIKYEKYYKRLSYSLEELERMKWHVVIR